MGDQASIVMCNTLPPHYVNLHATLGLDLLSMCGVLKVFRCLVSCCLLLF